jgi:hypothetical protein
VEPDAALLLCSDGLTDLVTSATVKQVVASHAGRPEKVAEALVKAANDAGGKDNITVVYAEGPRFSGTAPPPELHERRPRPLLLHSSIWLLALIALALVLAMGRLPDAPDDAPGSHQSRHQPHHRQSRPSRFPQPSRARNLAP